MSLIISIDKKNKRDETEITNPKNANHFSCFFCRLLSITIPRRRRRRRLLSDNVMCWILLRDSSSRFSCFARIFRGVFIYLFPECTHSFGLFFFRLSASVTCVSLVNENTLNRELQYIGSVTTTTISIYRMHNSHSTKNRSFASESARTCDETISSTKTIFFHFVVAHCVTRRSVRRKYSSPVDCWE